MDKGLPGGHFSERSILWLPGWSYFDIWGQYMMRTLGVRWNWARLFRSVNETHNYWPFVYYHTFWHIWTKIVFISDLCTIGVLIRPGLGSTNRVMTNNWTNNSTNRVMTNNWTITNNWTNNWALRIELWLMRCIQILLQQGVLPSL